MLRRWPIFLAGLYFLGGVGAWMFYLKYPDALPEAGLQTYVLPVSFVGMAIGKITGASSFVLVPSSLGDPLAHAVFFFPSLCFLTYLLGWRFPAIYRRMLAE